MAEGERAEAGPCGNHTNERQGRRGVAAVPGPGRHQEGSHRRGPAQDRRDGGEQRDQWSRGERAPAGDRPAPRPQPRRRRHATHDLRVKVAYQGEPGAYSDEAVSAIFPDAQASCYAPFRLTLEALEMGAVDAAVLPVANSSAGAVQEGSDLLWELAGLRVG